MPEARWWPLDASEIGRFVDIGKAEDDSLPSPSILKAVNGAGWSTTVKRAGGLTPISIRQLSDFFTALSHPLSSTYSIDLKENYRLFELNTCIGGGLYRCKVFLHIGNCGFRVNSTSI